MAVEILQAEKDIYDFVLFLYENGYILSHRDGTMKNVVLSRSDAINSLIFDLYMSGGTYYIGDNLCSSLVGFDSCGMQSHPSKAHTQGRFAGRIAIISANKEHATPIFKIIRQYIKKHYVYKQYNNHANMCCYFAPHYLELENEVDKANLPQTICQGFLHIRCNEINKIHFHKRITQVFDNQAGIRLERHIKNWELCWENKKLFELNIPFQYDSRILERSECVRLISGIIGQSELIDIFSSRVLLRISHIPPTSEVEQLEEVCQLIAIWELPWCN